jgi:hypothetical protein
MVLAAAIAALRLGATEALPPPIEVWLVRWLRDVYDYGVEYYDLELDELLRTSELRTAFLDAIRSARRWVEAQGVLVSGQVIQRLVSPSSVWKDMESRHITDLLTSLASLVDPFRSDPPPGRV